MDKKFDVIIVGAGPAGAACSLFLAEKNLSVLLLDKASFPRNKTWAAEYQEKVFQF